MEQLLENLNNYWETHEGKFSEDEECTIHMGYMDLSEDEDGSNLESELWDKLIIGSWYNMETKTFLEENGYHVWAGDKDSFGLLVVCISKDDKYISFG